MTNGVNPWRAISEPNAGITKLGNPTKKEEGGGGSSEDGQGTTENCGRADGQSNVVNAVDRALVQKIHAGITAGVRGDQVWGGAAFRSTNRREAR